MCVYAHAEFKSGVPGPIEKDNEGRLEEILRISKVFMENSIPEDHD